MTGAPKDQNIFKKSFEEILAHGEKIDDLFKDPRVPLGTNPYDALNQNTSPQENFFSDVDALKCVDRKYPALESLLKLVVHEYYPFGQMISEILRIAMDQIKVEAGSFLELDHNNNCLFFRAVAGRSSQNLLNFTVPNGQGIVGYVVENQQPMVLSNVGESSVYLKTISDAVGFETKNLIAFPVIIRGVTFGCIELLNRVDADQFSDADKDVLSTICEYGAKVIENRLIMAKLWKELNVGHEAQNPKTGVFTEDDEKAA